MPIIAMTIFYNFCFFTYIIDFEGLNSVIRWAGIGRGDLLNAGCQRALGDGRAQAGHQILVVG
jgi:hypothetical protein